MSTKTIAERALDIALDEVGYREGRNNWTKYAKEQWADVQNQAWCGSFVGWCLLKAGWDVRGVVWMPYVPYIMAWAKKIGAWTTDSGSQKNGDLVVYNWGGRGAVDHVGIVYRDNKSKLYRAVEGNTSPSNAGSQSNGGGVYIRYRKRSDIQGWVRMDKVLEHYDKLEKAVVEQIKSSAEAAKDALTKKKLKKLDVDGKIGPLFVDASMAFLNSRGAKLKRDNKAGHEYWKAWQRYLRTPVDGTVSKQSRKASEISPLGSITQGWDYTGPGSSGSTMVRALQRWLKVNQDGVVGPATVKAWQRKINDYAVEM